MRAGGIWSTRRSDAPRKQDSTIGPSRGEIDEAAERDPDLESWMLVSTQRVPEQTRAAIAAAGRPRGIHTMAIDWMPQATPPTRGAVRLGPGRSRGGS